MKKLLITGLILMGSTAVAQLAYKSVPVCSYWTYSNGGYMCSGYPMTEYIPDRFSLDSKIRQLEQRIAELESKLQEHNK